MWSWFRNSLLKDDFRLEDSLQALSKRVFQIESLYHGKVTEVKSNMKRKPGRSRGTPQATSQRPSATDDEKCERPGAYAKEVMNQMQQQMSGMMANENQMCDKPGYRGRVERQSA